MLGIKTVTFWVFGFLFVVGGPSFTGMGISSTARFSYLSSFGLKVPLAHLVVCHPCRKLASHIRKNRFALKET